MMNPYVNNEQNKLKVELTTKDKHEPYTPSSIWIVKVQVKREPTFLAFLLLQMEVADNPGTSPSLFSSSLTPYYN
jgi:hypothetical protein